MWLEHEFLVHFVDHQCGGGQTSNHTLASRDDRGPASRFRGDQRHGRPVVAAIEVFEGAQVIEVFRDRFIPVKTTNDLLVLRSDCYDFEADAHLRLADGVGQVPFVDLDPRFYKLVREFDARFAEGVPSLRQAEQLVVNGDWYFGPDVTVVGDAVLEDTGNPAHVAAGSTLG